MPRPISRTELEQLIDSGSVTIVEALSATAFEQGHLPGALQLGNDDVAGRAPQLLPDKTAAIVTYCASTGCQNSAESAQVLESLGYTDVREYVEGKADWEQAGLPLERTANAVA